MTTKTNSISASSAKGATASRTPGSWVVRTESDGYDIDGWDGDMTITAAQCQERADAAFIVTACNAHDELTQHNALLVAALRKADAWVAQYHDMPGHDVASARMSKVIRAALQAVQS
jgi:hypothetical protein